MTLALGLAMMGGAAVFGTSAPALGEAPTSCESLPSTLAADPLSSEAFTVVQTRNLYRLQQRPHARLPHGAAIVLEAPAGTTPADLHRALTCGSRSDDGVSPAGVTDARVEVRRSGDLYVVEVTSPTRSQALEIQRRAAALR